MQGSQRFEFCFQAVDFSLQILYHRGEGFLFLLGDGEFHVQIFEGFPGVQHLGFERHALVGKPSPILFSRTVTCSCLCYRHPSRKSPFLIDLGKFVVQGKKIVLVIYAVLTMEDFLEGELLILVYRQKRTVDVRIFLIAVDDEGDDVFLSIFICHKAVDVLCPLFYFWHSTDMLVTTLAFKIHLLIAKGKLSHAFR